jgi:hypothetical protein
MLGVEEYLLTENSEVAPFKALECSESAFVVLSHGIACSNLDLS